MEKMQKTAKTRVILHSDLDNFYASVEEKKRPGLKGRPLVVCGNKEDRHGVVLAKNAPAKRAGIKTGDVLWQAKKKCKNLIEVPADFSEYLRVSKRVRAIYERYTDRVEAFGIDECWLDVTASARLFGSGMHIAEGIRAAIAEEIGITASVGVSWNKIFAKLGSDIAKPDAAVEITPENFRQTVWPLPAEDLLYVGKATKEKLSRRGIFTIGQIAAAPESLLEKWLGKWGTYLYLFANGLDNTPVYKREEEQNIKSIGNSLTNYRDLKNEEEVRALVLLLADSVAARLRESPLGRANTVHVFATDAQLYRYAKQGRTPRPTKNAAEIADCAFSLFRKVYPWKAAVRGLGVSVSGFTYGQEQTSFDDLAGKNKADRVEETVDKLRAKYGHGVIQRAVILKDRRLASLDVKGEHVIHPEGYFGK